MKFTFPKQLKVLLITGGILVTLAAVAAAIWFISNHNIAVLNPMGTIADQQRQLLTTSVLLMALVVIPVFVLTFGIAWRYRAGNKKATYSPELTGNKWAEAIWWLIPFAIIVVLAGMVIVSSHTLDPFKKLTSNKPPLKVQVIALEWKWLFLYPEQHVAAVNYLPIPTDRPIDFQLTSDAPMNSFWIPQLGGQVYAMSGMSTQLHLMASKPGDYRGSSANISGEGFAGMTFTTHATPQSDFDKWVAETQKSNKTMTLDTYNDLAKQSKNVPPASYTFPAAYDKLYDTVIMKYMSHQ